MSAGPFEMTFTNTIGLPSTTFNRNDYYHYDYVKGVSTISIAPSETLPSLTTTQMRMDSNILTDLQSGFVSIACGWTGPNNIPFGVKIVVPYQLLGIGDRPYYEIAYGNDSEPNWQKAVSDPSEAYTFPTSIGYLVKVVALSQHRSLSLNITINAITS